MESDDARGNIEVYCYCRKPYDDRFMISCDSCKFYMLNDIGENWFHGDCIGLSSHDGKNIKSYECGDCIAARPFPPWRQGKRKRKDSIHIDWSLKGEDYEQNGCFRDIRKDLPFDLVLKTSHPGIVNAVNVSRDGSMVATCSGMGTIRLFDSNTMDLIVEFADDREEHIDEFYVINFSFDDLFIVTGGKRKNRYAWEEKEGDNQIMDCPLKIFSIDGSREVLRITGHTEEILCLKVIKYEGDIYYVTSSNDGSIMKCKFINNVLISKSQIMDGESSTVYYINFLPGYGNRYFCAATDDNIKLFDFQNDTVLQKFSTNYNSCCTGLKFVTFKGDNHYLIAKGIKFDDKEETHSCTLFKLQRIDDEFELIQVQEYKDPEFYFSSNTGHFMTNGVYLFAPDFAGRVFVWHLASGKQCVRFHDHGKSSVQDVMIHPTQKYLITCADSKIFVYVQKH